MDRIVLDRAIGVGQTIPLIGPPLEALRFQGARVGSLVTLTGPGGKDFRGRVLRLSGESASVLVFDAFSSSTESPVEIILLQALPEKERMEMIIQKTTELGVSKIIPFRSIRSVSPEEKESRQKKAHRWQHIAIKAVQQSRRARVPLVEDWLPFEEAVEACRGGLKIILWEKEGEALKRVIKRPYPWNPSSPRDFSSSLLTDPQRPHPSDGEAGRDPAYPPLRVYAMVGPEGGFAEEEVALARGRGFITVKLGQRILRTETAAITLVGVLQYEIGDFNSPDDALHQRARLSLGGTEKGA